jgi:integrase
VVFLHYCRSPTMILCRGVLGHPPLLKASRSPIEAPRESVMPVRLTETAISRAIREVASGTRRDLADAACPGLRLRLTPAGAATWVLACRDRHGRMRRFPLGSYPAVGISEARDEARGLHTRVKREGADPIAERRRDRAVGAAARAGEGTLAALLDLYAEKRGADLKRWGEAKRCVEVVFRSLLRRPLESLVARDFQMLADGYKAQHSAGAAVRYVRPILKWGASRGYLAPGAATIHLPAPVRRRKRVLTRDELAALLPVLRASSRPYGAALRFMLLTLTRRQETALARWRDVNLTARTWTITETKNGEPHIVPLSQQAVKLLQSRLPTDETGTAKRPDQNALVFATSTGALLGNWDRETKALQETSGTTGWTRHDLRRTGATMLGEMGELPDIIEAALNHASIRSPLAATYNRSRYRPQVAVALQRLADVLDGIESGGAEVLSLHSAG